MTLGHPEHKLKSAVHLIVTSDKLIHITQSRYLVFMLLVYGNSIEFGSNMFFFLIGGKDNTVL